MRYGDIALRAQVGRGGSSMRTPSRLQRRSNADVSLLDSTCASARFAFQEGG